jgi:hypothetical protein
MAISPFVHAATTHSIFFETGCLDWFDKGFEQAEKGGSLMKATFQPMYAHVAESCLELIKNREH